MVLFFGSILERKILLLHHSLLLTKSLWDREREKVQMEGFNAMFDIPRMVHPPEQCFLTLLLEAVCIYRAYI